MSRRVLVLLSLFAVFATACGRFGITTSGKGGRGPFTVIPFSLTINDPSFSVDQGGSPLARNTASFTLDRVSVGGMSNDSKGSMQSSFNLRAGVFHD